MNKYLRLLFLVAVLLVVASCGKQIPRDIIQPSDMENLLYDYHLALTMGDELSYSERYKRESYKNYVFNKHGVTEAEFDSSMVWYTRNGKMLTDIYKNLQKRYEMAEEQMKSELNKRSGQISVSLSGDSVDVWSDRNLYWLTSSPLTNRLMFDLKADTTFHEKDILVFDADYSFLSYKKNNAKAIVSINITFRNDSTLGISKVIEKSGNAHLVLKPDSAYEYKDINGFVYFSNPDSADVSVLINNIRLVRYREGSFDGSSSAPVAAKPSSGQTDATDINLDVKTDEVRKSDRIIRPAAIKKTE
ncbi:DUF4296 domain-containing protein [Bacteroides caecigallinarum]|uniref:DUF4296 domain-containing protein n=1 Tax=Bacteroides caecigallinarum TaxID=1411144 RepID=UPI00195958E7|nr:DUF4296 domain-containing protein [Bacteroides caecigallinarum]MBM6888927.1 DUF4296 domain-containing protein [Bacteroides caecigallinarum]